MTLTGIGVSIVGGILACIVAGIDNLPGFPQTPKCHMSSMVPHAVLWLASERHYTAATCRIEDEVCRSLVWQHANKARCTTNIVHINNDSSAISARALQNITKTTVNPNSNAIRALRNIFDNGNRVKRFCIARISISSYTIKHGWCTR